MTTVARTTTSLDSHWYDPKTGEPKHTVPKKDGTGNRPTTIRDARQNSWVPSVTTILKVLDRPALNNWKIEMACLAVLTTPRNGQELDAFVHRVLHMDKEQDQEAKAAADRGTAIHDALEQSLSTGQCSSQILPWIQPCRDEIASRGKVLHLEKILVGDGYAGKTDLIQLVGDGVFLWDWKSTTKLPEKGSYPENRLQLSGYAEAYYDSQPDSRTALPRNGIRTGNVFVSTKECGKFVIHENPPWQADYECFQHLVKVWQHLNSYCC